MTASWSSGNGGKYGHYRCTNCKRINYEKNIIENQFIDYLKEFSYKSELKDMLVRAIEANLEYRNESNRKG